MDSDLLNSVWIAAARAFHFAAAILLLSIWIFDRFLVPRGQTWRPRRTIVVLLPVAFLSGLAWFVLVDMNMSGLSLADAIHLDAMKLVWTQTQFGHLWQLRSVIWIAACLTSLIYLCIKQKLVHGIAAWLNLAIATAFVASLAWSGHGGDGDYPNVHLTADVGHLLACSLWPAGLYPLLILLRRFRKSADWVAASQLVYRFSAVSLVAVCLLILTGVVNTYSLIVDTSDLYTTFWGRFLLIKVAIFLAAIGIGAVNLLRLKPRLATGASAAALQRNVAIEMLLATMIIAAVGMLGMLPP